MFALVTGAAGFVGSHLCERLATDGHRVRAVDCLTSYYAEEQKRDNLDALRALDGCELLDVDHNILATQRLLEAVRGTALQRFVFASSSSVYGDAPSYPTSEDDLPLPQSPYGVTKLAAEHLCGVYARQWGVPTVSLRYFTVYGPRQRPDMAFHRLVEAALSEGTFPLY